MLERRRRCTVPPSASTPLFHLPMPTAQGGLRPHPPATHSRITHPAAPGEGGVELFDTREARGAQYLLIGFGTQHRDVRRDGLAALGDLVGVAARGDGKGGVAVEPAVACPRLLRKAAVRGDEGRAALEALADFGGGADACFGVEEGKGSEEQTSELQSLMRSSYA